MLRVYEITTAPDLSEQWSKLSSDEKVHTLIANRAADEKIAADARARAEKLAAERETVEDQIAAAVRVITIRRVDPKVWGRIVAENPARPGDPYDARMGVNTDTFDRAIMPEAITTVTDGTGEPVEWDWDTLANTMSPGQYEQIIGDVLRTHMERDAVPFSLADYRSRHNSEQKSK